MVDGFVTAPTPARWWPIARMFFRFSVLVPIWAAVSVAATLAAHDSGIGVVVGAAVALGFPYLVLWPAMRVSARRRGFEISMRTEPL
jgi:hypothetical protein